eukprot:s875_g14.t2
MNDFCQRSPLQKTIMYSTVAFAGLHNHHMEQLRVAFLFADRGNRGVAGGQGISCFEFVELGRKYSRFKPQELRQIFACANVSRNGKLSYCEWLAACAPAKWYGDTCNAERAFDTLDVKRNGFVGASDLCQLLPHALDKETSALIEAGHFSNRNKSVEITEVLEMSLSLVIASVPVALPMVMKVTLSIGAKEMSDEGGIVTHLTALEEIASMKVLCSDKTGEVEDYPPIEYVLRSAHNQTFTLEVSQETYMVMDEYDSCRPAFMKLDIKRKSYGPAMILGEVFMRHFFTVFSRGNGSLDQAKVGFARAKVGAEPKLAENVEQASYLQSQASSIMRRSSKPSSRRPRNQSWRGGLGQAWQQALQLMCGTRDPSGSLWNAVAWALQAAGRTVPATPISISVDMRTEHDVVRFVRQRAKAADLHSVLSAIEAFADGRKWLKVAGGRKAFLLQGSLLPGDRVVEFGTYMGYSAMLMASRLRELGGGGEVQLRVGCAADWLSSGQLGQIDMLLLDHRGTVYQDDLRAAEAHLALGARVLADNVLLPGAPLFLAHVAEGYEVTIHEVPEFMQPELEDWILSCTKSSVTSSVPTADLRELRQWCSKVDAICWESQRMDVDWVSFQAELSPALRGWCAKHGLRGAYRKEGKLLEPTNEASQLRVRDLRRKLRALGQADAGPKAELVKRYLKAAAELG